MAVRIRCKRVGRKNRPYFRIDVFDGHTRRDGRSIEHLGTYDPMQGDQQKQVRIKKERLDYWLSVGAKPTLTVTQCLKRAGLWAPSGGAAKKRRILTPEEIASREARKKAREAAPQPRKLTRTEKRDARKAH